MLREDNLCVLGEELEGASRVLGLRGQLVEGLVDVLRQVLLVNNIFFLLREYIHLIFSIFEPGVTENLDGAQSLPRIHLQQRVNQISGMLRELDRGLLLLGLRTLLLLLGLIRIRVSNVIFSIDD